jgi:flagellar biosynthesis/type III secretory pathway chaperone
VAENFHKLEACIRRMIELNQRLLATVEQKQQALREARPDLLLELAASEDLLLRQIGDAEQQRQEAVAVFGRDEDQGPMRLSRIAESAPEPVRGRLLVHHQTLRDILEKVRVANEIVWRATDGLLRHVRGVVQMVTRALNVNCTYDRRGVNPQSATSAQTFSATG